MTQNTQKSKEQLLKERKELEAQLAEVNVDDQEQTLYEVAVYDDEGNIIIEKLPKQALTKKSRSKLEMGMGEYGDVSEDITDLAENGDFQSIGTWLAFFELMKEPTQRILGAAFGIDDKTITFLPNLDVLTEIVEENSEMLGEKAKAPTAELEFLAKKYKEQ